MKIGDVVELNSGGLKMTISKIYTNNDKETFANVTYIKDNFVIEEKEKLNIKILKLVVSGN